MLASGCVIKKMMMTGILPNLSAGPEVNGVQFESSLPTKNAIRTRSLWTGISKDPLVLKVLRVRWDR